MAEAGALSTREAARLQGAVLKLNPKPLARNTTHLYERVMDEIERELGEDALMAGGYKIYTSVDAGVQHAMEAKLRERLETAETRSASR